LLKATYISESVWEGIINNKDWVLVVVVAKVSKENQRFFVAHQPPQNKDGSAYTNFMNRGRKFGGPQAPFNKDRKFGGPRRSFNG